YFNQGKKIQAAEFYSKAGYAYWNKGNNTQAANVFQKAFDLFSDQGNTFAAVTVGNNLGIIYLDIAKYHDAYTAFSHVLMFAQKTKNNTDIFNALVNLGAIALEMNTYSDAISKTNEALTIAKELNNLKSIAKCYSILAESYEKMGDGNNAYKYFELYSSIDQKIKKQELEEVKEMSAEEVNKAHETKRITEIELKIKKGELKLTQDSLSVSERMAFEREMQVELRNEQLQKKEITGQRNKLDEQNKKITDSIHYGLRIQQAMLPDLNELERRFEMFLMYRPKDIV